MCVFSPKEKDDGCLSLNLSDVHSTISFSNLIMGVILPLCSCSILFSSERRLMFCLDFTSLHVPRGSNRISIHSIFLFDFLFHCFLVHLAGLSSRAALARTQHVHNFDRNMLYAYLWDNRLHFRYFLLQDWSNETEMGKWEPTASLWSSNYFWIIQSSW